MTELLQHLINEARAAADPTPVWVFEGGRSCPLEWDDCSQPVFRLEGSDRYDYGEPGGPGATHCATACPHHGERPPIVCAECYSDGPCGAGGPCSELGSLAKSLGVPGIPVEPRARPAPEGL